MLSRLLFRPAATRMRLAQMASHIYTNISKSNSYSGASIVDIPKSWTFTESLPADQLFPTPADSHKTPRENIEPRIVKDALFTWVRPEGAKEPELLAVSPAAMQDLCIKKGDQSTEAFKQTVAGNKLLGWDEEKGEGGYPWAQCYGGWQFGSWAGQLGDGRAISLFETTNPETKIRYELALKGAGMTPYSRFADGKAVLRSSIREFIVSEALNALGIPSTRALSLTLLPHSKVRREITEPGAIVARFAQSWLRIGNFDILRARGDRALIRKLSTYIAENVFPGWESLPGRLSSDTDTTAKAGIAKETIEGPEGEEENRFTRLYREIVRRNARTVANWQAYGFMNGVLNTDNTSIFGLSIDFGPFAFLDNFDPNYTPNHDDHMLRYSYRNQPTIIWWNLVRLGESLGELMGAGASVDSSEFIEKGVHQSQETEIISRAETLITRAGEEFKSVFLTEYKRLMTLRLGLRTQQEEDFSSLYSELLDTMEALELDFNQFFRKLSNLTLSSLTTETERKEIAKTFFPATGLSNTVIRSPAEAEKRLASWLDTWRNRVVQDWGTESDMEALRQKAMKSVNPKFIAKNWVLEEVIKRVEKGGEREVLDRVMKMALKPFEEEWGGNREEEERFCGDVPKVSRAMQCSCSS